MKHFKIVGPSTTKEFDINDDEMITFEVYKIDDYSQKGQCHEPEELEAQNEKVYNTINECLSILENRLSFLDNEYSKQPSMRLKHKIGEVWGLIQDINNEY